MSELEITKKKYEVALQTVTQQADVIFTLGAELHLVKVQLAELSAQVEAMAAKPSEGSSEL